MNEKKNIFLLFIYMMLISIMFIFAVNIGKGIFTGALHS